MSFQSPDSRKALYLGVILIIIGILFNKWIIEWLFVADHTIESRLFSILIFAIQIGMLVSGAIFVIRRHTISLPSRTQVLAILFGIALPLVMLEVGTRLWLNLLASPEQYERYVLYTDIDPLDFQWSPHHYLNHYPTPNFVDGLKSHNSLGYRGDEFPVVKPEGSFRIVTIGGSTTYTVRVEDNTKTFPAQLENVLQEDYGHENVEVINAGIADANSWESLINLEFRVLDLDPDLVIVYHGTNDVHTRLVDPSFYQGDNQGRRKQWNEPEVPLWQKSALLRVTSRILGFSSQVSLGDLISADTYLGWPYKNAAELSERELLAILEANPPIYFKRNLESMVAIANAHGVGIMFSTWAHSPRMNDYASTKVYETGFAENNQVVTSVAETLDVPMFDFAGLMPDDPMYWADGRHVNEPGARMKAELFAEFIHANSLIP